MQTSPKVSLERLRKHVHPEPVKVVASNLLLGASLSGVDSLFAVSIQLMALSIGAAQDSQSLPAWVPRLSLNASLAVMTGTLFLRALVVWSQGFFKDRLGENFRALRRRLMTEVSFESREINVGDTLNLFNTFTFSAGDWIVRALVFVQGVGSILGLFAVLLYHSPMLFLAGNLLILVLSPLYLILNRRIRKVSISNKNSWQKIVRFLTAQMRNLTFLRISGTSDLEAKRLESQLEGYRVESIRLRALKAVSFPLIQLFGGLALCGLIFVAQSMGSLQSAALLGFVYLFSRYVSSAANCLASYSDCVLLFPYFQHLLDASEISSPRENKFEVSPQAKLLTKESPGWVLKNVGFAYPQQSAPVFTKLDLRIEPSTWVALIGNSGAGKSTLIQVLLGQVTATSGEATLHWGGLATSVQARTAELLRACGYVGAESYFLEGSLRENLLYGLDESPAEEAITRALELACCDFVTKLPGGLEYRLSDFGEGLSVGEKQRLALARALLRNPKLLVLDETMSFWDEDLELKIAENLKGLSPRPTIISAGHRSGAIERYADRFYTVGDKTLTELPRFS
jgi:ABC-type multidrug transport system fused ATPase/permease subunit